MMKTQKWSVFTTSAVYPPARLGLILLFACVIAAAGCKIRTEIKTDVSPKLLAARTADFDELLAIVNQYEKISDLKSSSLKATLTLGKFESGIQNEYQRASGYIFLRKPSLMHLFIQASMVVKTTVFEAVSDGDEFSAWLRDTNKVYKGRNSTKDLVSDDRPDGIPLRPDHLYEAIIPAGIDLTDPGLRISVEESADKTAKYYIMSVYREGAPPLIHTVRRIWIERSQLVISRVQSFNEGGLLTGDIAYSEMTPVDGFYLPLKIDVDRPEDGYSLALEFTNGSWGVNPGLDDDSFILTQREGAEVIELREK
jgi:outer membrane lipoprotein-sorting protein